MDTALQLGLYMPNHSIQISKSVLFAATALCTCFHPHWTVVVLVLVTFYGCYKLFKIEYEYTTDSRFNAKYVQSLVQKDTQRVFFAANHLLFIPKPILSGSVAETLRHLDIRFNSLRDFPTGVQNLRCLKTLDIGGNEIGNMRLLFGSLPKHLEEIGVSFNAIQEVSLYSEKLKRVQARGNMVSCLTCQGVDNVTELDFSYNAITRIPSEISNLKTIRTLNLEGNLLYSLPDEICSLRTLSNLNLKRNYIVKLPSDFYLLEELENGGVDLRYNKLIYPPQEVCDHGFRHIKIFLKKQSRKVKRKKSCYEDIFKVAIIPTNSSDLQKYSKKLREYDFKYDCYGNKIYVHTQVDPSLFMSQSLERLTKFNICIFVHCGKVSAQILDNLFKGMTRIKSVNKNCKFVLLCQNPTPVVRSFMNATNGETLKTLMNAMSYIQHRISQLKTSNRTLTHLDQKILESFLLARSKCQSKFPFSGDIKWHFHDKNSCDQKDVDAAVNEAVNTQYFKQDHERVMYKRSPSQQPIEKYKLISKDSRSSRSTNDAFSVSMTYILTVNSQAQTYQIWKSILNFISEDSSRSLQTYDLLLTKEDVLVSVEIAATNSIKITSFGADLEKVWQVALEIKRVAFSLTGKKLFCGWLLCPNCVRKKRSHPCRIPLELLDLPPPERRSHTHCQQEPASFTVPMSLVYPVHIAGRIWKNWQNMLIKYEDVRDTMIYPVRELNDPNNNQECILVLSRDVRKKELPVIETTVKIECPSVCLEARKVVTAAKDHKVTSGAMLDHVREIIHRHCDRLFEEHSNLNYIKFNPVKSRDGGDKLECGGCIALYCEKKGFIPIGEREFPEVLEDIPTDVIEDRVVLTTFRAPGSGPVEKVVPVDRYNQPLGIGCSISTIDDLNYFGTMGAFVEETATGKRGYLTCCHVLMDTSNLPSPGTQVVQPAMCDHQDWIDQEGLDPKKVPAEENVCGSAARVAFENVTVQEQKYEEYGMDAAFVEVHNRDMTSARFPGVKRRRFIRIFGQTRLSREDFHLNRGETIDVCEITDNKRVYKCGAKTGLTEGQLDSDAQSCVKLVDHKLQLRFGYCFLGKNLIAASDISVDDVFAQRGDSGSVVFYLDSNNVLKVVGMFCGITKTGYLIIPIKAILQHLNVKLCTFP